MSGLTPLRKTMPCRIEAMLAVVILKVDKRPESPQAGNESKTLTLRLCVLTGNIET